MSDKALWLKLDALIHPNEFRLFNTKVVSWGQNIALRCDCEPQIMNPAFASPAGQDELLAHCYLVSRTSPETVPSAASNWYVNVYLPTSGESDTVMDGENVAFAVVGSLRSESQSMPK